MGSITKRILAENYPVWQAKVRRQGYPTQSKTFLNRADAETWVAMVESEIGRGMFLARTEAERTLLKDAIDRYGREISPTKRSGELEHYKLHVLRRSKLAQFSLANVRGVDVAAWRDSRLEVVSPSMPMPLIRAK
jgi:hypothetical protein